MSVLFVVLGCALGGVSRYLLAGLITRVCGERFPWGTLFVNALGSFLLGFLTGVGDASSLTGLSGAAHSALLGIGFCGGLTTFSTLSLQSFALLSERAWGRLLGNVLGSVIVCLLCVLSGCALGGGLLS
jgi:CrcB protein